MKPYLHIIEQPQVDTTTFVLSCGRPDLLKTTLSSFFGTCGIKTRMVILDDSGSHGVFDGLVTAYGSCADVVCFPENRGQWWAFDFMVSYCYTPYIFYLEDDWRFVLPGYMQISRNILDSHRNIGTVDISLRTFEESGFDTYHHELDPGGFYWKKPWRISSGHLAWYGWVGSPNLKRREDLVRLGRSEGHEEWHLDRRFYALGLRSVYTKDRYVVHIGDDRSVAAAKRNRNMEWLTPRQRLPSACSKDAQDDIDYTALDRFVNWESRNE